MSDELLKLIQSEGTYATFNFWGFHCEAKRVPDMEHWCGYVHLPKGHPYYLYHYDDIPCEVHGGLTFAAKDSSGERWVIGFDCAHAYDLVPAMVAYVKNPDDEYRSLEYVMNEIKALAWQMREVNE